MRVLRRLLEWCRMLKIRNKGPFGSPSNKGVDAGRSAFVQIDGTQRHKADSLLKRINRYRARKAASHETIDRTGKVRNWGRLCALSLCLVASLGLFMRADGPVDAIRFLAGLDYFKITSVEVRGCVRSSAERVRHASGINLSASLLDIEKDAVEAAIKQDNSWVSTVELVRSWPDTLLIRVHEYEPAALIAIGSQEKAVLYYIDSQGVPFVRTGPGMDLDFPVITGLERIDDIAGSERLKESLLLLRLLGGNNPNLPAQSVSEIHVDQRLGLVIHLVEHPFPIFFGSGDVRENYFRLRKVLEVLYKPRKMGMEIARVAYIRMDYLNDKVIVGYSTPG